MSGPVLRRPRVEDVPLIRRIARRSLDGPPHPPCSYALLCRDFARTSLVASLGEAVVGYVLGYRPPHTPEIYVAWQWAVEPPEQRTTLAVTMLSEILFDAPAGPGRRFETIVTGTAAQPRIIVLRSLAETFGVRLERTREFGTAIVGALHGPMSMYWFEY